MRSLRKVVIFGLPYSPNVGDGVIADCLAFEISRQNPGVRVTHIDLAGRSGPGQALVRRGMALGLLGHLTPGLRQRVVTFALRRLLRRLEPDWARAVAGADVVLLGGGQILSDVDLNFPLKLEAAAQVAKAAGVPVGIVAAGVAANWTPRGAALFGALAGANLRYVALRDAGSIANWVAQMPQAELPAAMPCRDPGLLAAQCYGLAGPDGRGHPPPVDAPVGIGIADPAELILHADHAVGDRAGLLEVFVELAIAVAARGIRVRLFCNGSGGDATAMREVFNSPRLAGPRAAGKVELAQRPRTGAELGDIIAGCRAIVAHRLHACIVAHALDRPFVGLVWDAKLDGFLQSVGMQHCLGDAAAGSEAILARLDHAVACDIDPDAGDRVRAECRAQLATLLAAFGTI